MTEKEWLEKWQTKRTTLVNHYRRVSNQVSATNDKNKLGFFELELKKISKQLAATEKTLREGPGLQPKKPSRTKQPKKYSQRVKSTTNSDRFYLCRPWRELRYQALIKNDGRCECCGASAKDGIQLHVDHIKPRSKFPELQLELSNLQILCDDCNIGKSNVDSTDWRGLTPVLI